MNEIYVTGHRNPDTDSIVAAMSYAALQNALGRREYVAAHLDHINDETRRMLDRFGFEPPVAISNVRTQVRDLDFDTPPALDASVTMDRAWRIMLEQRISVVPVTTDDGKLHGMLSAGDIASYDMRSITDNHVENLPLFNLLSVLEGRVQGEGDPVDTVSGTVSIAVPQSIENLLFEGQDHVVICGDQPDMIRRALEHQVSCLILCQTEGLVSFHLDDYIDDVREEVLKSRYRCYPVLDENDRVVGTLSRYHLLRPRRKRVVLVDHNERAQAVPGLDQAEILEIIDHHRLADIQTAQPVRMRNEPVGSTNTIIAGMYQEYGVMPSPNMAGLIASAILSDTVIFKSPTCTKRDIDMAERMARIAKVSLEEVGKELFSASGSDDKSAEELFLADFKEFHIAEQKLGVSQITCVDSARLLERKAEFLELMASMRKTNRYDMVILMLTDVLLEGTQLVYLGSDDTISRAFSIEPHDNTLFLPGVMSRKKQIIPMLTALWG